MLQITYYALSFYIGDSIILKHEAREIHVHVRIMMYALIGGVEVLPDTCGYKRGVLGQAGPNPIKENGG